MLQQCWPGRPETSRSLELYQETRLFDWFFYLLYCWHYFDSGISQHGCTFKTRYSNGSRAKCSVVNVDSFPQCVRGWVIWIPGWRGTWQTVWQPAEKDQICEFHFSDRWTSCPSKKRTVANSKDNWETQNIKNTASYLKSGRCIVSNLRLNDVIISQSGIGAINLKGQTDTYYWDLWTRKLYVRINNKNTL